MSTSKGVKINSGTNKIVDKEMEQNIKRQLETDTITNAPEETQCQNKESLSQPKKRLALSEPEMESSVKDKNSQFHPFLQQMFNHQASVRLCSDKSGTGFGIVVAASALVGFAALCVAKVLLEELKRIWYFNLKGKLQRQQKEKQMMKKKVDRYSILINFSIVSPFSFFAITATSRTLDLVDGLFCFGYLVMIYLLNFIFKRSIKMDVAQCISWQSYEEKEERLKPLGQKLQGHMVFELKLKDYKKKFQATLYEEKWNLLQIELKEKNVHLTDKEMYQTFSFSSEISPPDQKRYLDKKLVTDMVQAYIQRRNNFEQNIKGKFDLDGFKSYNFSFQILGADQMTLELPKDTLLFLMNISSQGQHEEYTQEDVLLLNKEFTFENEKDMDFRTFMNVLNN